MLSEATERKLRQTILPFFISCKKLNKKRIYRAHYFYDYVQLLCAGLGVTISFSGMRSALKDINPAGIDASLINGVGVAVVLTLIAAKVYFSQNDIARKATLAKSCQKDARQLQTTLAFLIANPEQLEEGIGKMQTQVGNLVERHVAEESWPSSWLPWAGGIDNEVETELQRLGAKLLGPVPELPQQRD